MSFRDYPEWDSYCFLCYFWVVSSLICVRLCVYNVYVLRDLVEIRILNKKDNCFTSITKTKLKASIFIR